MACPSTGKKLELPWLHRICLPQWHVPHGSVALSCIPGLCDYYHLPAGNSMSLSRCAASAAAVLAAQMLLAREAASVQVLLSAALVPAGDSEIADWTLYILCEAEAQDTVCLASVSSVHKLSRCSLMGTICLAEDTAPRALPQGHCLSYSAFGCVVRLICGHELRAIPVQQPEGSLLQARGYGTMRVATLITQILESAVQQRDPPPHICL